MKIIPINERQCAGCTKCCDGWLTGVAHGHQFRPGRPCHYVGTSGCTIYEQRPENPCVVFKCEWLTNYDLPEWFKPSESNVICTKRVAGDIVYLEVIEAGQQIDSSILAWLVAWCLDHGINLRVQVKGSLRSFGSQRFLDALNPPAPVSTPEADATTQGESNG